MDTDKTSATPDPTTAAATEPTGATGITDPGGPAPFEQAAHQGPAGPSVVTAPPQAEPRRRGFRLRRSPSDAMLSGVCAGIAEELSLDTALVRIAMVVLTVLTSGVAAAAYLAAWVIAPVEAGS